jgi:hypothetical protein
VGQGIWHFSIVREHAHVLPAAPELRRPAITRGGPGLLFLDYEIPDLESFLLIGIVNGWEMHLFPQLAYGESDTARAVVAHDNEWIAMYHTDPETIREWTREVEHAEYTVLLGQPNKPLQPSGDERAS